VRDVKGYLTCGHHFLDLGKMSSLTKTLMCVFVVQVEQLVMLLTDAIRSSDIAEKLCVCLYRSQLHALCVCTVNCLSNAMHGRI